MLDIDFKLVRSEEFIANIQRIGNLKRCCLNNYWMESSDSYIDLSNVRKISRGDSQRMLKYIRQFKELIPERLRLLKKALQEKDRVGIRQITHKMIPQLKFFGVQDVSAPISRLEFEYNSMPMEELEILVLQIIASLEGSVDEISKILSAKLE